MNGWINNRSVGAKLAATLVLTTVGLLMVATVALLVSRQLILREREAQIRSAVEIATGYADALQAEVAAGKLTPEQAEARFVELTSTIRYGQNGYFAAYGADTGVYVMHGARPDQVGVDGSKLTDPAGRHFIQNSMDLVHRNGAGFYELLYPKPGSRDPVRKLNYAKLVPAWNVIVSSGMYVDDLDDAFAHEATLLGLLCLPIVLVCIAASWLVRWSLAGGLRRLSAAMLGLAEGNLTLAIPGLTRRDEVGAMARSVEVFKDGLIRGQAMEREAAEAAAAAAATREQAEAARAAAAAKLQEVVGGLAAGLSLLAKGDLGCSLTTSFAAEYETLRRDFNSAVGQLAGTMGQIVANTRAIASNTVEITSAADDLARRTEQQAASLEETTAALDRITTTVRETAEGAQKACTVVAAAQSGAQQSAEIVKEAVAAMTAIEGSSQQISQIIGVIDEIAFQTNLLALNAGVEAARAGDTGRGFAVVASEVRALAQRSADAAKEIKSLISVSGQEVARGVQLVGQTGRSLDSIVGQVEQISGVVVTIAASAREQATALSEVNVALNHMDQVTQQNAAMVEQSTAACHNLSGEAAELDRLTSQFSVERHAASG